MILIDTNIIIELLKGNSKIIDALNNIPNEEICISSVTFGELIYGARNKNEQHILEKKLKEINIIEINTQISKLFKELIKKYSLSHRLNIPDALIASTAIITESEFFTLNIKDFKYIPEIQFFISDKNYA